MKLHLRHVVTLSFGASVLKTSSGLMDMVSLDLFSAALPMGKAHADFTKTGVHYSVSGRARYRASVSSSRRQVYASASSICVLRIQFAPTKHIQRGRDEERLLSDAEALLWRLGIT